MKMRGSDIFIAVFSLWPSLPFTVNVNTITAGKLNKAQHDLIMCNPSSAAMMPSTSESRCWITCQSAYSTPTLTQTLQQKNFKKLYIWLFGAVWRLSGRQPSCLHKADQTWSHGATCGPHQVRWSPLRRQRGGQPTEIKGHDITLCPSTRSQWQQQTEQTELQLWHSSNSWFTALSVYLS